LENKGKIMKKTLLFLSIIFADILQAQDLHLQKKQAKNAIVQNIALTMATFFGGMQTSCYLGKLSAKLYVPNWRLHDSDLPNFIKHSKFPRKAFARATLTSAYAFAFGTFVLPPFHALKAVGSSFDLLTIKIIENERKILNKEQNS
jgi:hypothetical protein